MGPFAIVDYDEFWFVGQPYREGEYPPPEAFHYNHGVWESIPIPCKDFTYLHFFGPNDGWGFRDNLVCRYNGAAWNAWAKIPGVLSFNPRQYNSPADIWGTGELTPYPNYSTAIVHYNGSSWVKAFEPGPNTVVMDVAMYDGTRGWASGYIYAGENYNYKLWKCADGVWSESVMPAEMALIDVGALPNGDAWALSYGHILRYHTELSITPTSLGRIRAAYAPAGGSALRIQPPAASCVPEPPAAVESGCDCLTR